VAKAKEAEERRARLAAQLRANLGRRKAQQRERIAKAPPSDSLEENGE
jgi:hypothetical protein